MICLCEFLNRAHDNRLEGHWIVMSLAYNDDETLEKNCLRNYKARQMCVCLFFFAIAC